MKRTAVVLVSGVFAAMVVVLVVVLSRSAARTAALSPSTESADAEVRSVGPAPEIPTPAGARPWAARAVQRGRTEARDGDAAATPSARSGLIELIQRLRDTSSKSGFHELAWPLVEEIAGNLAHRRPEDSVVVLSTASDDGEDDPVRGALLIAMALSPLRDQVPKLARQWIEGGSGELERSAWIARSLAEGDANGLEVPLTDFKDLPELMTFPARPDSFAPALAEEARLRLGEPLPEEYWTDYGPADPHVQDEILTRRTVLLAGIGPAVEGLPWVRDFLLEVVVSRSGETRVIAKAATYVVALAARNDALLAERLLAAARESGRPAAEILILKRVALDSGRLELVVDPLLDLLRATKDDATGSMCVAFGVDLLLHTMRSESEEVRTRTIDFAVDRALDSSVPVFHRELYLNRIAALDLGLMVDTVEALLATEDSPEVLDRAIPYLGGAGRAHVEHCRMLLQNKYETSASDSTRRVILKTIAGLGGAGSTDFLRAVSSSSRDEELRALAQSLLDGKHTGSE